MDANKRTTVDLGMVRVVTRGNRDAVYLVRAGQRDMLAFTVTCRPGERSVVWLNVPKLQSCPDGIWRKLSDAYLTWKRSSHPEFALPLQHHAHLKSGKAHPWARGGGKRRVRAVAADDDEPKGEHEND